MHFDWHVYLSETGAEISPLKLFTHVTKSLETLLKPGEILEVNISYILKQNRNVYVDCWWPAEVVTISGHLILFKWCVPSCEQITSNKTSEEKNTSVEQLNSYAFWFDSKGPNWKYVKPIGWCRSKNIIWSPPISVSKLIHDTMDSFKMKTWILSLEKISVSHMFFERRCLYAYETIRVGGYFECEHEYDPSCVWPVKVSCIF